MVQHRQGKLRREIVDGEIGGKMQRWSAKRRRVGSLPRLTAHGLNSLKLAEARDEKELPEQRRARSTRLLDARFPR